MTRSLPPRGADGPEVRAYWEALHKDLAELELRDALAGVRMVIAERLRQARAGGPPPGTGYVSIDLGGRHLTGKPEDLDVAAALLAAELDRAALHGTSTESSGGTG